jgi:hypothetical protein
MGKMKYEVSSFCSMVLDLLNAKGKQKKKERFFLKDAA